MQRALSLARSSVGRKVLMALSGIVLWGYVFLHMAGNLKIFSGREGFNAYAAFLREVGYPIIPYEGALWGVRLLLLAAVSVHVWAAYTLWRTSALARPVGYRSFEDQSFSYASRTMRWGGVIVLLFVAYHILHLTTGNLHRDFVEGDVYHNFIVAFRVWWVLLVYLVAQAALCLHLYHGIWSLTQTLGLDPPRVARWRRPVAAVFAVTIFVGFVLPPVLVFAGRIP